MVPASRHGSVFVITVLQLALDCVMFSVWNDAGHAFPVQSALSISTLPIDVGFLPTHSTPILNLALQHLAHAEL